MNADLLQRLLDAGTSTALVAEVALEIARAEAAGEAKAEPSAGALRTRRYREKLERERHAASQSVTGDAPVTLVTENVTPPLSLSPNEINSNPHTHTPEGDTPPTHGAPEGPRDPAIPGHLLPATVTLTLAAYLASLTASRDTALAALWNGTPPPQRVSDDIWTGYLAHRKAHPKAGKLTPRAYALLCQRLLEWEQLGVPPNDALDRAIERGWITVLSPKEARNARESSGSNDHRPSARHRQDGFGAALREARDRFDGAGVPCDA